MFNIPCCRTIKVRIDQDFIEVSGMTKAFLRTIRVGRERNVSLPSQEGTLSPSPRIVIDARARGRALLRTTLRGSHEYPRGASWRHRRADAAERNHTSRATTCFRHTRDAYALVSRLSRRGDSIKKRVIPMAIDERCECRIFISNIFANILLRLACHVTIEYGKQRHGSRAIRVDVVMDFTDSIFGTWSIDYLNLSWLVCGAQVKLRSLEISNE